MDTVCYLSFAEFMNVIWNWTLNHHSNILFCDKNHEIKKIFLNICKFWSISLLLTLIFTKFWRCALSIVQTDFFLKISNICPNAVVFPKLNLREFVKFIITCTLSEMNGDIPLKQKTFLAYVFINNMLCSNATESIH